MWNRRHIYIRAPDSPVQALEDDVMDVFDPVDIINDNDDINKDENDDREAEGYPNLGRFHVWSVGSQNMDTNFLLYPCLLLILVLLLLILLALLEGVRE